MNFAHNKLKTRKYDLLIRDSCTCSYWFWCLVAYRPQKRNGTFKKIIMNLFKILETCATSYGCAVADLKRADRRENVTLARQTAITILLRKGLSPSVLATLLNLDLRALKYNAERAQKGNLLFAKRVREIETVLEKGGETASPEREVQSLLTKTCKALGVRLEGVEGGGRGESARARNLVALAMYKRGHSHALISKLLGRSSPSSSFNMCDEAEELIKISKYESVFKKLS